MSESHVYVYTYIRMCVCVCIYIYRYMYVYIYIYQCLELKVMHGSLGWAQVGTASCLDVHA